MLSVTLGNKFKNSQSVNFASLKDLTCVRFLLWFSWNGLMLQGKLQLSVSMTVLVA